MIRWIRQSFRRQLFVALLIVTLLMVIGGGIISVQGFRLRLREEYRNNDLLQESMIRQAVEEMLDDSCETLDVMAQDKEFIGALTGERSNGTVSEIYTMLYRTTAGIRDFASASIYIGSERKYTTDSQSAAVTLPVSFAALRKAEEYYGRNVCSADMTGDGEGALLIARKLSETENENGMQSVYAVIKIRRKNIENALSGMLNARDYLVLTNEYLRPFCSLGSAGGDVLTKVRSDVMNGDEPGAGLMDNVYMSGLMNGELYAIYVTPPVLDFQAVRAQGQILAFLAVVGTCLSLVIASWMAGRMSKPIAILAAAMKRLRKGDLEARVDFNREDEFEQLATGFNKTALQLDEMMREQVENERQLNGARIAMMQAQLNPHFLYNTLDTIKWVAKANQVPEIATLSQSLAGILRSSISEEQFVPLSQEIKLVRNYCDIQRIRFDDFFDLTVKVEPSLENAYVPKLILQPIVENAIIHGLEDRREGHILVEVKRCEKASDVDNEAPADMEISVTDNGKGISDEMIQALEAGDSGQLTGHLGLEHVGTILRLYYGENYGIKAERLTGDAPGTGSETSETDGEEYAGTVKGTRMTLRLPVVLTRPENSREEEKQ